MGAHLQNADFEGAHLENAVFAGAQLRAANFARAKLLKANFGNAQLQKAYFGGAQLGDAYFGDAQLQKANFEDALLQDAYFGSAQLQDASFADAKLHNAYFGSAQLQNAVFDGADLEGARFRGEFEEGDALGLTPEQFDKALNVDNAILPRYLAWAPELSAMTTSPLCDPKRLVPGERAAGPLGEFAKTPPFSEGSNVFTIVSRGPLVDLTWAGPLHAPQSPA